VKRALWAAVVFLVMVGVAAAILRMTYPNDLATRADPMRWKMFAALHLTDPVAAQRAEESRRFDSRFAAHPFLTLLHVGPGALFLLLAPLQFIGGIRRRYPAVHRWSGRLLAVIAICVALPALFFGLGAPIGGAGEQAAIAVFGGLFLFAIVRAWIAIREKQEAVHREWMIRAFALAIAIAVIRVVGAAVDITLTPAGVRPPVIFVIALWIGWPLTILAAELWIRHTRTATALTGFTRLT
jgi:uncharacterized membrane protein YozB (DUF420 family)